MKFGLSRIAWATFTAVAIVAAPTLAFALEAPVVAFDGAKPSTVRLTVQAGSGGAPAGFTAEWMKKTDFDALGGWPQDGTGIKRANFTGTPVWTTEGTGDYTLNNGEWMAVELGQLFDETGVSSNFTDELQAGTDYVVRISARGTGVTEPSAPSPDLVVSTLDAAQNCTYTIGYWKTHPEAWPTGSLTLGSVNYTAAELLSILNQPSGGNGLIILAHQLIAAKLNIINGADPSTVAATIAAADALIGALVVPPVGGDYLDPSTTSGLAHTLDDFNNGLIGPGHCGEVPATPSTWGRLKNIYHD